jgi:hypothetical protein
MREIKESDWKILGSLHAQALERFCKQALLEVERVNSDGTMSYHEKFLAIHRLMRQRDKEVAQTFDGLRRSTALTQLAAMKARGLVADEEFSRFRPETREMVGLLLRN